MRTLSKAAEEKLLAAIEKAASYVNGGMTPNDAIVKSAGESNIPAGHINLMVHAYNTGRTTKQRETGENTLEKAADFDLADVNAVTEALFPKQVKTSQEVIRDTVVSTEYAVSPAGMLARRKAATQKEAAAQHTWPTSTYVRPPRDDKEVARRQYSQKVAEQREYEEYRRQASAAYSKAAATMEALHDYFRRPGNMSFQDAMAETELRIGSDGVTVLKKIAAVYPHLEKQVATNLAHFGACEPVDLVTNVLHAVNEYNAAEKRAQEHKQPELQKKKACEILTESILYRPEDEPLTLKSAAIPGMDTIFLPGGGEQKIMEDAAYTHTPEDTAAMVPPGFRRVGAPKMPPAADKPPMLEQLFGKIEPRRNATAGGESPTKILDPVGRAKELGRSVADSVLLPTDPKALHENAFAQLTDPQHETMLRNIRAKSVLNDLIMNDPVVSGYDPSEVTIAFNELSELAPSIVDSPAAMQAIMRKRLEAGQFADFDVKQLLDMEKTKADTQKNLLESKGLQRQLI